MLVEHFLRAIIPQVDGIISESKLLKAYLVILWIFFFYRII
jgi:hypothetical protein